MKRYIKKIKQLNKLTEVFKLLFRMSMISLVGGFFKKGTWDAVSKVKFLLKDYLFLINLLYYKFYLSPKKKVYQATSKAIIINWAVCLLLKKVKNSIVLKIQATVLKLILPNKEETSYTNFNKKIFRNILI